jgi:F0F1-type ATP synthase membrane subunit b/b'
MANLDLIPKLPVLAVQAGIFVANLGIMKKLFMEPYLKVREAQDGMTVGSQGDASRLLAEADRVSSDVNARLLAAMAEAKAAREKVRAHALSTRQSLLEEAQTLARQELDKVETAIRGQLQSEREKVPSIVASLSNEVFNIALI